jgi:hypothetical protein
LSRHTEPEGISLTAWRPICRLFLASQLQIQAGPLRNTGAECLTLGASVQDSQTDTHFDQNMLTEKEAATG